ncbi:MAG: hypothetical protein ACHQUC_06715 [Chlamydiales bacterium]
MTAILYITKMSNFELKNCEKKMNQAVLLAEETRKNHTAHYSMHNRYFSNGDKPWVILVNTKNKMKLTYNDAEYIINEDELVFFDDNIMHSWEMNNNDMKIYYYRAKSENPVKQGTYCLDEMF